MHFILTAIGSYGDVHPMVGLGAALARRKHRVSVVANPYFANVVQGAGLELLSISTTDDYLRLIEHPHVWRPVRAVPFLFREAIVKQLPSLYSLIEQNYIAGETVVAAHTLDAASRVFRDKTGASVAAVAFSPQVLWSDHQAPVLGPSSLGPHMPAWINNLQFWLGNRLLIDHVLKRPLNAFRREKGLGPTGRLFPTWWFRTDLNICLFPDWFAMPQPDWPGPLEMAGFPLWDAGDHTPLPSEVETFLDPGAPPIVFTAGTANVQAAEFFQTAVDACRQLGRRGILLTKFRKQLPERLPESIAHFSFVPLTRLLPRSAAFVHHGGIGSSSQGLAAGIPQLVRPLAFDQFDNAHRLQKLGVAEQLRPRRFHTPLVAGALQRLLSSEAVAANCRRWAEQCDGAAAIAAACTALEQLASSNRAR